MAKNTLALWLAPIGFLLLGIGIALGMRRQTSGAAAPAISAADRAQIEALKQHRKTTNKDSQP